MPPRPYSSKSGENSCPKMSIRGSSYSMFVSSEHLRSRRGRRILKRSMCSGQSASAITLPHLPTLLPSAYKNPLDTLLFSRAGSPHINFTGAGHQKHLFVRPILIYFSVVANIGRKESNIQHVRHPYHLFGRGSPRIHHGQGRSGSTSAPR